MLLSNELGVLFGDSKWVMPRPDSLVIGAAE